MNRLLIIFLLLSRMHAIGQKASTDHAGGKEPFAIAELGGAASWNPKSGGSNLGFDAAVEVTPIENWLELELGVSPTFAAHFSAWEIDLLFKKPWTLSQKAEFMVGVGPVWTHASDHHLTTNAVGGEIVLDFMFWPWAKHRLGWYVEPAYEYDFNGGHEQSVGASGGLLVAIP